MPVEPTGAPWRVLEATEPDPTAPAPRGSPPPGQRAGPWLAVGPVSLPWLAAGAAGLVVALGVAGFLVASSPGPVIQVEGATGYEGPPSAGSDAAGTEGSGPADGVTAGGARIVVDVGGAVQRPGVYDLPAGARVGEAIEAAGGFGPRVDAAMADRLLNLASVLRDGDEVHVPARGEASGTGAAAGDGGGGSAGGAGLVDLNRATPDELDTLPGVGPATVAKIVAAREEQPFASIDDLGTRGVVGPATLEKIRPLATVGP